MQDLAAYQAFKVFFVILYIQSVHSFTLTDIILKLFHSLQLQFEAQPNITSKRLCLSKVLFVYPVMLLSCC